MRIDRLALTDFKNLCPFEVDFDETSTRQVVVGRNGVGKSNLLEALAWIFRDLDLEEDSAFSYEIEYLCNRHFIKVRSSETNKKEAHSSPVRQFTRRYWIATEQECANLAPGTPRPYQEISEADFSRRNRPLDQQP